MSLLLVCLNAATAMIAAELSSSVEGATSPITNQALWQNSRAVVWPDARRPQVERTFIYSPVTEWTYSHHPSITHFNGRFYAIWSNGPQDEDSPGQRVLISTAQDFKNWSKPRPLVDSVTDAQGIQRVLTAAGFHVYEGVMTAYVGNYGPNKETTHLQALSTTTGDAWSPVWNVGVPVCPNHGPQRTASGRLIISGNISFPYTDDPAGKTGWKMSGLYPESMAATIEDDPFSFREVSEVQGWGVALCEGSFYQTDNGVIHMLLRDSTQPVAKRTLWVTESRDDGVTWSTPEKTAFSDSRSKFHFGRLPDGRFYSVSNSVEEDRNPLVLSVSRDGVIFGQHYILADSIYDMKRAGRAKGGQYGYPHSLVHDGFLYVIVSRRKEAVEVMRINLSELEN